ncbi:MAG: competence protein ComEA [Sulfurimonas sp.]|nr:MAG: competence protein ComEA [Sulfurimonas sp.]PHS55930.1 MAG: competence protein ComEA [Sulfurimonas sp.]PHS59337.1 MAG: competence protein ComEA [Sulfurimonas sp.]
MKIISIMFILVLSIFASVDINIATAEEFTAIKGVGAKKAYAIVQYRKSIKCFKNINQLAEVKGISNSIISKNIDNLKASPCNK